MSRLLVTARDERPRGLLAEQLHAAGHQILTASTGGDGIWLAREQRPDLLLVDDDRLDGVRELVLRVRATMREIWGAESGDDSGRALDTCVKRLRQKLGRAGHYVETVRSVGYRFRATP